VPLTVEQVQALVFAERERQERLHPGSWPSLGVRLAVLTEEVGEVAKALNDREANSVRDELVQVVAVCLRWLERDGMNREHAWMECTFLPPPSPRRRVAPPTRRLAEIVSRLGEVALAVLESDRDNGRYMHHVLLWCAARCVDWLCLFDEDPLLDEAKRQIREQPSVAE
jgi:NTP pyrophosphatase (non-canonical NTP hydrolase)